MNLNKGKINLKFMDLKNVAKGSFQETEIEHGFLILTYQNESNAVEIVTTFLNKTH